MTEASNLAAAGTHEVIESLRQAMETGDDQAFLSHFAEDAVYETPFVLGGRPSRWEGYAAISEHLGQANPVRGLLEFTRVTVEVHQGADPHEATVQFAIEGRVRATGEAFALPSSVGVVRVRDGKVVRYQDYVNTLRGAQVAGVLPQFAESLRLG
ncbi:nuclear transport factor 2 family protein [Actinokineospora auranticolor]|uniref:Ketosteroid isomerase-like protein n=1 Tax=Actinokineospora auranticolor TaxID=155976 RepID=A0A2S6H1V8_9PSEU|nr:nuclear transport factor 2 family protein [Actinokineospora auranticolor]PPK71469.1 ketosteroid isomerase-like protein [Actinokineospora auranticolor]